MRDLLALDAQARGLSFDTDFPSATAGEWDEVIARPASASGDAFQLAALRGLLDLTLFGRPGDVQRQPVPHFGSKRPFPTVIRLEKWHKLEIETMRYD